MKLNKIFLLLITITLFNFSYSQNSEKKKIGVIFNIDGPYKIIRRGGEAVETTKTIDQKDLFYRAYKFLETGKGNPTERLTQAYLKNLDSLNLEVTQIKEVIDGEIYPKYDDEKREYSSDDLKNIKMKYNLNYLLIVTGQFGLQFEQSTIIVGDKITYIF